VTVAFEDHGSFVQHHHRAARHALRCDDPRKTSLADYADADIGEPIWNLNATPRKCLGYRTPIEVFAANLGVASEI
jgi:IS30 family transposase